MWATIVTARRRSTPPPPAAAARYAAVAVSSARFLRCALMGRPDRDSAHLIEVSGNNQVGQPGEELPVPLVVRLEDRHGNPIIGEATMAEVTQGEAEVVLVLPPSAQGPLSKAFLPNGIVTSQVSVLTDDRGEARFALILGASTEGNIVTDVTAADQTLQFVNWIERIIVGDVPLAVSLGDLNGDSALEIVTANARSNDITVLLGRGDGSFDSQRRFILLQGNFPASIALSDLNHDGIFDIVTTNLDSNDISILHGQGDGTFLQVVVR